jgi:hypothetical protein
VFGLDLGNVLAALDDDDPIPDPVPLMSITAGPLRQRGEGGKKSIGRMVYLYLYNKPWPRETYTLTTVVRNVSSFETGSETASSSPVILLHIYTVGNKERG